MTAQTTARPAASSFRIAPMIVLVIAILAFVAGLGLARVTDGTSAFGGSAAQAAQTFDATLFRAGERAAVPTFDAARFRADERSEAGTPAFDAVQFRAAERQR